MTGGQLVDDLMSNETLSAATGALSSLGRQIQSNPVPFALIGVGLAWACSGRRRGDLRWAAADLAMSSTAADGRPAMIKVRAG